MNAKVIKVAVDRTSSEEDIRGAISGAIAEAISEEIKTVIEDGPRPSEIHEYKMSMAKYAKHRRALHETVSLMIKADETVDNIMALIFSIGFGEGYNQKESELKEEPEKDDD